MKLTGTAALVGSFIILHVFIGSGYNEGGSDSMCWKTTDYTLSSESKVLLTSCPTGLSIEFDVSDTHALLPRIVSNNTVSTAPVTPHIIS